MPFLHRPVSCCLPFSYIHTRQKRPLAQECETREVRPWLFLSCPAHIVRLEFPRDEAEPTFNTVCRLRPRPVSTLQMIHCIRGRKDFMGHKCWISGCWVFIPCPGTCWRWLETCMCGKRHCTKYSSSQWSLKGGVGRNQDFKHETLYRITSGVSSSPSPKAGEDWCLPPGRKSDKTSSLLLRLFMLFWPSTD